MTTYIYTKKFANNVWTLDVTPMPDWQEFDVFCEQFLTAEHGKLIEKDYGMDRHQVRFRVGKHQYILQFEHYSESIWVEQDY